MISLDQVQLLEKKVATIVAKMNELQKQNAALAAQNEQLKATLAAKNEQLKNENEKLFNEKQALMHKISSFEADQNRIEQGILNALDRLNSMENDVTKSVPLHSESHSQQSTVSSVKTIVKTEETVAEKPSDDNSENKETEESSEEDFEFGLDLNFEDEVDPNAKPKMDIF